LEVLAERLEPAELDATLRAVGQRLARGFRHAVHAAEPRERIQQVLTVLEEIGGLAEVEEGEGRLCLRGFDCPLGAAMTGHRQVCRVAEALLTDLLGVPVREHCRATDGAVRCYFEIVAGWGAEATSRPANARTDEEDGK
jgi:predicted ArsR family transcriptional regulator